MGLRGNIGDILRCSVFGGRVLCADNCRFCVVNGFSVHV